VDFIFLSKHFPKDSLLNRCLEFLWRPQGRPDVSDHQAVAADIRLPDFLEPALTAPRPAAA